MATADMALVKPFMQTLQDEICQGLESVEPSARFVEDSWVKESGGGGRSRVMTGGEVFEKGGVNFSHVIGDNMPGSATAHRPELAGRSYQACGVSLVMHPDNPFVPTSHANVRFFIAEKPGEAPIWWFGGGFDLTPYYGFDEDCIHWHQVAKKACDEAAGPFNNPEVYKEYKEWCDRYFYLKHRDEPRGIGGLFFDDLNAPGFDASFDFIKSVGRAYIDAYLPIVKKRMAHPFDDNHKAFQRYRRGRYVEFNLVYDRGTLFGLQSGGRTESILMSMPPQADWAYNWHPEAGSEEARLCDHFLQPHDWANK